jgi:trans-aconitate methyltransferase
MQLNFIERLFILSPIRAFLQNHLETRQLLKMGGCMPGAKVLEVGCGPGFGIDLLYSKFKAASVDAFDVDPKMVFHVRQRQNQKNRRLSSGWGM